MKFKKFDILLLVLLMSSILNISGFEPNVSNPTTVNAITLSATSGVPGDKITGKLDVTVNDTIEYMYVQLSYYNSTSGITEYIDWLYVNSTGDFFFVIQNYWPSGTFFIALAYITQVNYATEYFYNGTDFISPELIISGTTFDNEPPTLVGFTASQSSYTLGEFIVLEILLNETNPVDYISIQSYEWNGTTYIESEWYYLILNQSWGITHQYITTVEVTNYTRSGDFTFLSINVDDKMNNWVTYNSGTDFSVNFSIYGTINDDLAPEFISISQGSPIRRGNIGILYMEYNETGSGFDWGYARFVNLVGADFNTYFYPVNDTFALAYVNVPSTIQLGQYNLSVLHLYDKAGNSAVYTPPYSIQVEEYVAPTVEINAVAYENNGSNFVEGTIKVNNTLPLKPGSSLNFKVYDSSDALLGSFVQEVYLVNETTLKFNIRIQDYLISFTNNSRVEIVSISVRTMYTWVDFYSPLDFVSPDLLIIKSQALDYAYFTQEVADLGSDMYFVLGTINPIKEVSVKFIMTREDGSTWTNVLSQYYSGYNIYDFLIYLDPLTYSDVVKISVIDIILYLNDGTFEGYSNEAILSPSSVKIIGGNLLGFIDPLSGTVIKTTSLDFSVEVYNNYSFGQTVNIDLIIRSPDGVNTQLSYSYYLNARTYYTVNEAIIFKANGNYSITVSISTEYSFFLRLEAYWVVDSPDLETSHPTTPVPSNSTRPGGGTGNTTDPITTTVDNETISSDPDGTANNDTVAPPTLENPLPGFELNIAMLSIIAAIIVHRKRRNKV